MNLSLETILHGVAVTLRDKIAPSLNDSFAIETSRLAAMLVTIAAHSIDDAAAARIWENDQWRQLFASAHPIVPADLGKRLADAAASVEPGFKISELDRENDRLRRLLVELQTCVESGTSDEAQAVNRRIWHILREGEERRAPRI